MWLKFRKQNALRIKQKKRNHEEIDEHRKKKKEEIEKKKHLKSHSKSV